MSRITAIAPATLDDLKDRLPNWLESVTGTNPRVKGDKFSSRCPSCQHHKAKMDGVVKGGTWVATCRVCGLGGDLLAIAGKVYGCDFLEAVQQVAGDLGIPLEGGDSAPRPEPRHRATQEQRGDEAADRAAKRQEWPAFIDSPVRGVENVARLRGIPWEGVRCASDWGVLRFGNWKGEPSWILRSPDGTCAEGPPDGWEVVLRRRRT